MFVNPPLCGENVLEHDFELFVNKQLSILLI